jgi:hypothetical protein
VGKSRFVKNILVYGASDVNKKTGFGLALAALALGAIAFRGYTLWQSRHNDPEELLSFMPSSAAGVLYVNLQALRNSAFLAELCAWAPQPNVDADYAEFMQATGFNYERDLDRAAIAVWDRPREALFLALADGRFDRKRITTFAMQSGTRVIEGRREIFSVPMNGSARRISFTFIQDDRIAITDQPELSKILSTHQKDADAGEWRMRFEQLAGSPIFSVIRQEADAGNALVRKAPGGLRSPQLSALLDQVQWFTLAGKPQGDRLDVVMEGECATESTAQQLADLLNGVLVLAQAGLNDSKTRNALDPGVRDAYLEMVKGAEVSRINRGETKSVRLIFEVTPKFLQAARTTAVKPTPIPRPRTRR